MLINKHLDCLHSSNCITTVLRETQLLKIPVTISAIYMFIHMHLQYFIIQLFMRWRKGHYSDQLIMTYISLQNLSAVYSYCIKVYKLNSMRSVGQLIEVYIV